jgi:hypothetical protein
MTTYKLQVQEDEKQPDVWHDVRDDAGNIMLFTKQDEARAALAARYPVLVRMEALGVDRKRTRVIVVNAYQDIDDEREGKES